MNPFQLILGIEAKQPMDLAIIRTSGTHSEGSNDTKKMAKDREERKLWTIKFLEKGELWETSQ